MAVPARIRILCAVRTRTVLAAQELVLPAALSGEASRAEPNRIACRRDLEVQRQLIAVSKATALFGELSFRACDSVFGPSPSPPRRLDYSRLQPFTTYNRLATVYNRSQQFTTVPNRLLAYNRFTSHPFTISCDSLTIVQTLTTVWTTT